MQLFSCPIEFFYQTDQLYGLGCSFLFHRQRKTMPLGEQRRLIARLNVLRMQVERLLRGTEMDSVNSFVPLDIEQYGSPERIAGLVRTAWKLPPGPVSSVVTAVEIRRGVDCAIPVWQPEGERDELVAARTASAVLHQC